MMNCEICGGVEVIIQGGIEYCKECSSQILGSCDEEVSDESFTKKSLLSSPSVKKQVKSKKQSFLPWTSFEAYNFIISKQVKALIELGCSEKLKTVVLHIWAQYLQQIQVAFRKDYKKDQNTPLLSAFAYKRDIQLLYGDGTINKQHKKLNRRSKHKSEIDENKSKGPKVETKVEIKREDDNDGVMSDIYPSSLKDTISESGNLSSTDDLTDTGEDSEPSVKLSAHRNRKSFSSYARRIKFDSKLYKKKDFRTRNKCCHHMDMLKTLSFCQLGLLYTEDQIQLFDLLRLVNEDKVPYIEVTRHFPPTMQLQASDSKIYGQPFAPGMKLLSVQTAKLKRFLNLPKFKNPPLLPFAVRFIKDLNLPNDLIPAVKVLIDKFEAERGDWYVPKVVSSTVEGIPLYEVQAMAHIIIALKMLLVLDDQFENEHGKVMEKLNSVSKDKQFFVWSEWQQHMFLKEYLFLKSGLEYTDMNRIDSLCADRILNDYPYPRLNLELVEQIKEQSKREYKARNVMKNILEPMFSVSTSSGNSTSFPLTYQIKRFMAEWKNLPLYKETEQIDFSLISKDFSRHKLHYDNASHSQNSDDIAQILFSSLYETDFSHNGKLELRKLLKTSRNYWCVRYKCETLQTGSKDSWLKDLPKSFQWLLKLSCKYLQVNYLHMYLEIKDIEYKLILSK